MNGGAARNFFRRFGIPPKFCATHVFFDARLAEIGTSSSGIIRATPSGMPEPSSIRDMNGPKLPEHAQAKP
jgi:hypothetical protein